MNRNIAFGFLIVALAFLIVLPTATSFAQGKGRVAFRVNMSIKMREGTFIPGSGDALQVKGGFNGWGGTDTLKDNGVGGDAVAGDSIYTWRDSIAVGAIQYKFYKTLRGGLDWESNQATSSTNREYTVASGDQTVPTVYFDNDNVYTPPVNANVTFQVNMKVKLKEGAFRPNLGDIVRVAGSFNDWGNSKDTLKDNGTGGDVTSGDSIYSKAVSLLEGTAIQYKFLKTLRAGEDWEGVDNRQYTVPVGGGTTPVPAPYFNGDSVVNQLVNGQVLWSVNMNAYVALGWFDPNKDTIQVRGSFNGWGGGQMDRVPSTNIYEVTVPFDAPPNSDFAYKYRITFDGTTGNTGRNTRFPGYSADEDGYSYEHPAERGDGNSLFSTSSGGNLEAPSRFFSGINPGGVLDNDTVTVTFRVDMRPAIKAGGVFSKTNDTAFVVWNDKISKSRQGNPADVKLFDNATNGDAVAGDSIYSGKLTINPKAHYNVIYLVSIRRPDNTKQDEGAGLGAQNGYRSRFIPPTGANAFPRNYTFPIDVWQASTPYPAETPPFTTGVEAEAPMGVPTGYALLQNYPNPFNPSTRIKYQLTSSVHVRLRVFNILGQAIADLVNGVEDAGNHIVTFEGSQLPTGMYFYQLEAGNFRDIKKMVLLK